ncbi:hypothetical protein DFH27DRAFT_631255 [Peziza echinospora]|nr:hypothetical protein DFH27DRAFT_631255 [Peziza echinospora]
MTYAIVVAVPRAQTLVEEPRNSPMPKNNTTTSTPSAAPRANLISLKGQIRPSLATNIFSSSPINGTSLSPEDASDCSRVASANASRCPYNKSITLGERFAMVHTIGKALLKWFLVDWVHKSVSSLNLCFFKPTASDTSAPARYAFPSPYLGCFEYARPLQGILNEAHGQWNFLDAVYRHPARQGAPTDRFQNKQDIYAFGMRMLEVGLWQVVSDIFPPSDQKSTKKIAPDHISKTLRNNARAILGYYVGPNGADDDAKETKLIAAFKENVVDVFATGCVDYSMSGIITLEHMMM